MNKHLVTQPDPSAISDVIASFRDQDWKMRFLFEETRCEIADAIKAVSGVSSEPWSVRFQDIPGCGVEIYVATLGGQTFTYCPIPSTHDLYKLVGALTLRIAALEAQVASLAPVGRRPSCRCR